MTEPPPGPDHVLETAFPGERARFFSPYAIGDTPEEGDHGAALILSGAKTLTSSPLWDYPDGRIPFVGALCVLLDGAQSARGIVETTRVELWPFAAVTDEMALAYGEGDGTVAWWRRVIGRWYRESAGRHGASFCEDTTIVWEWFRVVHRL